MQCRVLVGEGSRGYSLKRALGRLSPQAIGELKSLGAKVHRMFRSMRYRTQPDKLVRFADSLLSKVSLNSTERQELLGALRIKVDTRKPKSVAVAQ